jgi:predicted transcriptional regulator
MSFLKYLQDIGDRLGILETVENPDAKPAVCIQTRTVTLSELSGEIQSAEVQALAESSAELQIPFEKIFEAAGIPAFSENWTIETIKKFVSSEASKGCSKEEVQKALLEALKAGGVQAESVIKNAMAQDQALDSFEKSVCDKVHAHWEAQKKKVQKLEMQIQSLREQISSLGETIRAGEEQLINWKNQKRAYERGLASAIGYLVDHQVITTDED